MLAYLLMGLGAFLVLGFVLIIINPVKFGQGEVSRKRAVKFLVGSLVMVGIGYNLNLDKVEGPALTAVLDTIPQGQAHTWVTGQVDGGVAVVVNGSAGYWVKDGEVFAANGIARNMSPGVEFAPSGIDWKKIASATN
ncbi:hypothetical protein [Endozoicomonas sp. SESOKO4]|uniref:hypothetical protein n=1 Tax=Endozoicomonas sp. SESOKO4 TaxID=2828745 RepID=UPI0021492497|nr:hypothetical protein [Endozoicomonas sp. SESOKO4]